MALPGRAKLEQLLVVARLQELEDLATPLRVSGLEVETRVLTGRPFVELIRQVVRRGHDLVMKSPQGAGGALGGVCRLGGRLTIFGRICGRLHRLEAATRHDDHAGPKHALADAVSFLQNARAGRREEAEVAA